MNDFQDRVIGCIVGASIGDALGGAVEMWGAEGVRSRLGGGEWLEDMLAYAKGHQAGTFGVWRTAAPRGTGTDDTRFNHLLLETAIRAGGPPTAKNLAQAYIEGYEEPTRYYPQEHAKIAKEQFAYFHDLSCAFLGREKDIISGLPPEVILAKGNDFPMLLGLLSCPPPAGLFWPGQPEETYKKVFSLNYFDIGYALDATSLAAAFVSAAIAGKDKDIRELVDKTLQIDPYGFDTGHQPAGQRPRTFMARMPDYKELANSVNNDRELMLKLAHFFKPLHIFDPVDVLGTALTVIYYTQGDVRRSLLACANHRELNPDGSFLKLRDVDCVAFIAGALLGAFHGLSSFPEDWVECTLKANKEVYGIDIMKNAQSVLKLIEGS